MTAIRFHHRTARRFRPGLLVCTVAFALAAPAAPVIIAGVVTPEGRWSGAWGVADPETDAAMEVGMHTRIGSITKTFTGTALMQLAEAGKLSLDDTIDLDRAESIRIRLASVSVDGARILPLSALTPIWQGRIGAEITLADLYRIEINSHIPGIDTRLALYLQRMLDMHQIRVKAAERGLQRCLSAPTPRRGNWCARYRCDIRHGHGVSVLSVFANAGPLALGAG